MKSFTKKISVIWAQMTGLIMIGLLTVAGCKKEEGSENVVNRARIQVIHASPGTASLDFYVDNTKQNTSPFGYFTNTGYFEVSSGNDLSIDYRLPGTTTSIASQILNLRNKVNYTLYLTGLSKAGVYTGLKTFSSADTTLAPASRKAKIRVANAAADGVSLDFYNGGTDYVKNLANATVSGFAEYTAGKYTFHARKTGEAGNLASIEATLEAGKIYTLLARGITSIPGASGAQLTLISNN